MHFPPASHTHFSPHPLPRHARSRDLRKEHMNFPWVSRIQLLGALFFCLIANGFSQQITYPDFTSGTGNLQLNGSSTLAIWPTGNVPNVVRLTDGSPGAKAGTVFFQTKQPVAGGFTTYFKFQMHSPESSPYIADGIAFVVQNAGAADPNYGASGSGITSLGFNGGGIGYTGIPNSLAIEFDIYGNAWDPESPNLVANHVAIQTCGTGSNNPAHIGGTTIANVGQAPSCLLTTDASHPAINTQIPQLSGRCLQGVCTDGAVHEVVVEYDPPSGDSNSGELQVWIDPTFISGTHTPDGNSEPALDVPYTIGSPSITTSSTQLSLDSANGGSAWVGFSGAQGSDTSTQDIMAWEFTPHVPTQVEQPIPPGGTTAIFNFGSHNLKVTYPLGFVNTGNIVMEVTASPISPTAFQARVAGTPFAGESCIVYEGTGGNCMVYSVQCEDPNTDAYVPCPSEPSPTIDIKTSYDTTQTITDADADFLKADPIGSNNWVSIFTSFVAQRIDGTTAGKGNNFSDLVATFNKPPTLAAPVVTCTPPSSTVWYASNVNVPCTTTSAGELADPSQSSFSLKTSVLMNMETASASTGSAQVCDIFSHCTTAGPYTFMVDQKAPTITITTPPSGATYQVNTSVTANFSCVDGGSGINPSACVGTVPKGNKINTASVGSFQFNVQATDLVGNMSSLTDSYTVGFGNACLFYIPTLPIKRGLPVPIAIRLCDASGKNLSKPSIQLHAVNLVLTSTGATYPIIRDNNNDLDDDFQFIPILNWYGMIVKTTGLPAGKYNLVYTATGDPAQHTISFLLVN